jgi:hypothetical protein
VTPFNVVIILRDARTISFQANDFHGAAKEVARMFKDPCYGTMRGPDPVFIGHTTSLRAEYSVGELTRAAAPQPTTT